MKKSYLALGLVAAVAMSSCSNDEPMPQNPNQPAGTENLEPVRLSMTTSAADVEVSGARTRGTGTVGGIKDADNLWNYEELYILMTSSQDLSDDKVDNPVWGFTDVNGVGPYLKQQFDGSFWARPSFVSTNNGNDGSNKAIWTVDYKIDHNEWWYGAPIDKFYPLKGASDFFAYHIDDATTANTNEAPANAFAEKAHKTPVITVDTENKKMTVDFKIDGSQDLMAGYAVIPEKGYAAQDKGFSAQSARNGEVPQITMSHLLSRFTFEVVKGDHNFNKVTLDAIKMNSKANGTLTVADAAYTTVGDIAWVETEATEKFSLMQKAGKAYEVDAITNQCKNGEDLITFDSESASLVDEAVYYTAEDGLYYIAENVKVGLPDDVEVTALGVVLEEREIMPGVTLPTPDVNVENQCLNSEGDVVMYEGKPLYFEFGLGANYYTIATTLNTAVPADAVYSAKLVCTNYSLENGKAKLEPFASLPLNTLRLFMGQSAPVGEALFVSPESEYTLEVVMTYLVREQLENANVQAIETAKAQFEAGTLSAEEYKKAVEEAGGALTEQITQKLPLKLKEGDFLKGHSYNVKVTIYGLKEVVVDVELENWEDGGELEVGQDDELKPEFDPNYEEEPTPGENDDENN